MSNNTYKYWFFYIKPEYLHLVCTEEDNSLLYAYTDNKEYANIFKEYRDMNKFFMVKREIDRDEVNHLAKNFMREYLIKKTVKTKFKGIGSEIIDYDLILTQTEDFMIQHASSKIILDLQCSSFVNPSIFKNEYFNILTKIGLKERYDNLYNRDLIDNKYHVEIQPDLLSIFIKEFGFLLSIQKGNE